MPWPSALGEVLARPLDDVFAEEIIAVPAARRGTVAPAATVAPAGSAGGSQRRHLRGRPIPVTGGLVNEIINGPDRRTDPWSPDALVWPLLEVIDGCVAQDWCQTLGPPSGCRRCAGGAALPVAVGGMRWRAGWPASSTPTRPIGRRCWPTGCRGWDTDGLRCAASRVTCCGRPNSGGGSATSSKAWTRWHAREAAVSRLQADVGAASLPERVSLFGPTRLPQRSPRGAQRVGVHRDVHLWLPHPSPALWDQLDRKPSPNRSRRSDRTVPLPIIRCWPHSAGTPGVSADAQRRRPSRPAPRRLAIADDAARGAAATTFAMIGIRTRSPLDSRDRSVQVHACHGPARQVEVLREILVGLLADDSTLEPRDVLVMCPDIEIYAPLIAAAFGLADVVPEAKGPSGTSTPGAAGRPGTDPDQSAAGHRGPAAGPGRRAGQRIGSAGPRLLATGASAVRIRRRRPRSTRPMGRAVGRALGD